MDREPRDLLEEPLPSLATMGGGHLLTAKELGRLHPISQKAGQEYDLAVRVADT